MPDIVPAPAPAGLSQGGSVPQPIAQNLPPSPPAAPAPPPSFTPPAAPATPTPAAPATSTWGSPSQVPSAQPIAPYNPGGNNNPPAAPAAAAAAPPQPGQSLQPATPNPAQAFSLRQRLAASGYNFDTDEAAFAAIQGVQAQQAAVHQENQALRQRLAQLGQAQPPAPGAAPPAAKPSYWNKPDFDPALLDRVTKDANGNLVPRDGMDFMAVQKVREYAAWLNQTQDKFWQDPIAVLKPGLEEVIQAQVQQHLQGYQAQVQQQQHLQAFKADAEKWAFQKDAQGRVVQDQTGAPVLSPTGQVYAHFVREAVGLGLTDIQSQDAYARRATESEILRQRAAAQAPPPAPPPPAPGYNQFAPATYGPTHGGTVVNAQPSVPQPQTQNPNLTLGQLMNLAMQQGRPV